MELWEAFGSRESCLAAPTTLVNRCRMVLIARHIVEAEETQKVQDAEKARQIQDELRNT